MGRLYWPHGAAIVVALAAILLAPDGPAVAAASDPDEVVEIADLKVAVWRPAGGTGTHPLILFSHGFRSCKTHSSYLMRAFAKQGMLVMAPDHADNRCRTGLLFALPVPTEIAVPATWSDGTFADRRDDMTRLLTAVQSDPKYAPSIDSSRVALVGHSLGGYTVLGLSGAWPSWQVKGIAAVVMLAPYVETFLTAGNLASIKAPLLFQAGDKDRLAKLDRVNAVFAKATAPRCLVVYEGARHLAWVDPDRVGRITARATQPEFRDAIAAAAITFLNAAFGGGLPKSTSLASLQAPLPECE